MQNDLKDLLDDYNLIPFMVTGLLIALLKGVIGSLFCFVLGLSKSNFLYEIVYNGVPLIAIFLWGAFLIYTIREKRYFYLTGRKLNYDVSHYKRTFKELVDYFTDSEPHKLDTGRFREGSWRYTNGIIFGKKEDKLISIPSNSEGNIAVFGPPGSGKTSGLAIINAMQFEGSVLAIDIKGDLYNFVHQNTDRKILRFSPDAEDALRISCHFDPFANLKTLNETEKGLYLENMATILIPDEGGTDGNYFTTRARKLFQGITILMLYDNPNATFPDVVHAILQGNVFDWVTKSLDSPCIASKELLASFYGNSEKNVSGAYDALTTALIHFSNPILDKLLTEDRNTISISSLEAGFDIYLQIKQENLDAYAPLFTLLIQSFSTSFTKRPDSSTGKKNRPILFLLDEFPQLTFSYKMINTNLSTLRSKSVICMLIQQNLAQLEYRYQDAGARSILGNCSYQAILGSNDIHSSKIFSEMFGRKKVLRVSSSITENMKQPSTGRSVQETEVPVFPPEYFGDLSDKNQLVLYFKGKYLKLDKLNCYLE